MAGLGVSTDVIDECLNHKLASKVARIYIKDRRLAEQARAFDALRERLEAIVAPEYLPLRSPVAGWRMGGRLRYDLLMSSTPRRLASQPYLVQYRYRDAEDDHYAMLADLSQWGVAADVGGP